MVGYKNHHGSQLMPNDIDYIKPTHERSESEWKEEIANQIKNTLRIRNLSISVLVFVLLWIACISMGICFFLFQVGFAEKYPTLTLKDGTILSSGLSFVKEHSGSSWNVVFESAEQENAFYFSRNLSFGLSGVAFLFCLVANILLTILKKLNDDDNGPSFLSGAMGILFSLTGFVMFGTTLGWILGLFSGGGVKWFILVLLLFIIAFLFVLMISLVIFTICGIIVSSITWREASKELKSYNA